MDCETNQPKKSRIGKSTVGGARESTHNIAVQVVNKAKNSQLELEEQ